MNKFLRISVPIILACLLLVILFCLVGSSNPALAGGEIDSNASEGKEFSKEFNAPQSTLVVNTLEDELNSDGDCSLREAIEAANTNMPVDGCGSGDILPDIISFGVAGTINILYSLPVRNGGALVIDGGDMISVSGGGPSIYIAPSGELLLQHLVISDGYFSGTGGGLYNEGKVSITNCTITDNRSDASGGGIFNIGILNLNNSTISGNESYEGGGIFSSGTMTITNSTITGNTATELSGGGISNRGTLIISNSTISANDAMYGGAGIDNIGDMTIFNSNIYGNSGGWYGGGIHGGDIGDIIVINTIVADNSGIGQGDCYGNITDGGHNIDSDGTCGFNPANGSMPNVDPLLGPLQNNGGPTLTHALLRFSPAIDAGDDAHCPATDQRGVLRPIDGNWNGIAICDIGPFEFNEPPPRLFLLPLVSKSSK